MSSRGYYNNSRIYGRSSSLHDSREYRNGQSGRTNSYARSTSGHYVYGSAARAVYPERDNRRQEDVRRKTAPRRSGSFASVLLKSLIAVAMFALLFIMGIHYVMLMSNVTAAKNSVTSLENQIKTLKAQNDQREVEVHSTINLDEVKYIAITELGMKYASEDQIITYENRSDDYVHQVSEIGN